MFFLISPFISKPLPTSIDFPRVLSLSDQSSLLLLYVVAVVMLRWQEVEGARGVVVPLVVTVAALLAYRNFKESKHFSANMSRK